MRVKELTKQYDGKTVVDSVSFEIPKGKVISLIGPNGAGKSTVMGIISRLIARDSGLVDFDGRDIAKWKSKELSKRLAILTQMCIRDRQYGVHRRPVPQKPPAKIKEQRGRERGEAHIDNRGQQRRSAEELYKKA